VISVTEVDNRRALHERVTPRDMTALKQPARIESDRTAPERTEPNSAENNYYGEKRREEIDKGVNTKIETSYPVFIMIGDHKQQAATGKQRKPTTNQSEGKCKTDKDTRRGPCREPFRGGRLEAHHAHMSQSVI